MLDQTFSIVPATLDDSDELRNFLRLNYIKVFYSSCKQNTITNISVVRLGFTIKQVPQCVAVCGD